MYVQWNLSLWTFGDLKISFCEHNFPVLCAPKTIRKYPWDTNTLFWTQYPGFIFTLYYEAKLRDVNTFAQGVHLFEVSLHISLNLPNAEDDDDEDGDGYGGGGGSMPGGDACWESAR